MAPEIRDIIQQSLDTIEAHLRSDITAGDLAAAAGFSLSHFYHVFEAVMGISVGRYISYRRLLHAAWDIHHGKDATAAALEYGFDTHAGFYKAFRKEFGCGPTQYLRTHPAARPARINLKEEPRMTDMKTIACALAAWNMADQPVTHIYYANTGYRSDHTFAVGSSHYIKVSDKPGELARQAALHRALMEQDLTAPIVPTPQGDDVLHMNDLDFLLMQRLQGETVHAMALLDNPVDARALGEGLARLHRALRSCDPLLCYTEDYLATMQGWAIPTAKPHLTAPASWLDAFQQRIERTFPALPVQIIHRDPNPDNILMHNGRVAGFLDFDLTRVLPRIFDLCYAATGILCDTYPRATAEQKLRFFDVANAIWQGYDAVEPLSDVEKEALPDMVLAIQLTCVAAFAGSDKLAQQFEVNQEMLNFILQNMERFRA